MNVTSFARYVSRLLALLVTMFPLSSDCTSTTPEACASDYLRALQVGDWGGAANFIHTIALGVFKRGWVTRMEAERDSGRHVTKDLLFGPNSSLEEVKALDARRYFMNTLTVISREFSERQSLFDTVHVLRSVNVADDLVYVQVRLDIQDRKRTEQVYEEIIVKRDGAQWGIWLDQKAIPGVDRPMLARANAERTW